MFCPRCGNDIKNLKNYCDNCGEKIVKDQSADMMIYQRKIEENSTGKGLSISGFIFGFLSFVISFIIFLLINKREYIRDANIIPFIVFGSISGVLLLIGFILSVMGVVKSKDVFGVLGIVFAVASLVFELLALNTALSIVFH